MENKDSLFELAIDIIGKGDNCALTGSLMLNFRGIKTRREPTDIDILVKSLSFESLPLTDEFFQDSPIYPESVRFRYKKTTVDFLLNIDEEIEVINGIPCGSVGKLLDRKYYYYRSDKDVSSSVKHRLDLEFMGYDINSKNEEYDKELLESLGHHTKP